MITHPPADAQDPSIRPPKMDSGTLPPCPICGGPAVVSDHCAEVPVCALCYRRLRAFRAIKREVLGQ